jgi:hypothetical protein
VTLREPELPPVRLPDASRELGLLVEAREDLGSRQLNRALFSIAFAQVRTYPPAKAFVARKRTEGKSWREAIRALKRHLARVVFRQLSLPISQVPSVGRDRSLSLATNRFRVKP